jgi:hypothetical protein
MRIPGTYNGTYIYGGTYSTATYGFIYIYIYTKVWRATSGRRTPRRAADGRTPRRAADRRALYYGWAYMLTLWGKGGYGGSPNVEAGKMYQQATAIPQRPMKTGASACLGVTVISYNGRGLWPKATALFWCQDIVYNAWFYFSSINISC